MGGDVVGAMSHFIISDGMLVAVWVSLISILQAAVRLGFTVFFWWAVARLVMWSLGVKWPKGGAAREG